MMPRTALAAFLALTVDVADADLYMHHPRGSNNKLNEVSNNVQNDNRLFDSQNNGAGGYQVGDNCVGAPGNTCQNSNGNYDKTMMGATKGQMYFYEGSKLAIEWTNQHGCGQSQPNVKCEIILQYMCEDENPSIRDGTDTKEVCEGLANNNGRQVNCNNGNSPEVDAADPQFGVHEPLTWYQNCRTRERNKGLYIADQNLNNKNAAINTRQNRNGEKHGFECPEERDYYPYWHPTPWRDVAVFTDDLQRCDYYSSNSQNNRNYGMCCDSLAWQVNGTCIQQLADVSEDQNQRGPNNHAACIADPNFAGTWVEFGRHNGRGLLCERSPFSRDNHLGNSVPKASEGKGLAATNEAPTFMWNIPRDVLDATGKDEVTCVLRMRYNISTTDFDGWSGTDSKFNGEDVLLPNNPRSNFLGLRPLEQGTGTDYRLRLAINTAQFARTFEDRSHTFRIKRRTSDMPCHNKNIHNLNVRGRRGNIVQVYPAVEYDFIPQSLNVYETDCIHFQWTGSDANPRNNAGNGRDGTDRSNIVEIGSRGKNKPVSFGFLDSSHGATSMFSSEAMIKKMAYLDQELNCTGPECIPSNACDDDEDNNDALANCAELNSAAGYFDAGPIQMNQYGTFDYMSSRNNAFTNRSQKAKIIVVRWIIWVILGSTFLGLFLIIFILYICQRKAQFDPKHRLHSNRLGRFLVVTGKSFSKIYERTWMGQAPWSFSLLVLCALFYIVGMLLAAGGDPAPLYVHAKGCGRVLDLVCNLVFLPVLRNFMSWLRTTPIANVLPLGEDIYFHKFIFCIIALAGSGHIACHYYDYWWHSALGSGDSIVNQAWANWTGISGHLIFMFMFIMFITAIEKVRRNKFKLGNLSFGGHSLFVRVHKLWIIVLMLLWTHSKDFWHYSLAPTALLIIDKLIGRMRGKVPVELVEAHQPTRDVIGLKLRQASHRKFRYKSGQYLFLHCPAISTTEWHPFTISSSPEERTFSVHIRCRADMDWTYALKKACLPDAETKAQIDKARVALKEQEKQIEAKADKMIKREITRRAVKAEQKGEPEGAFDWFTSLFSSAEKDVEPAQAVSTPLEEARRQAMGTPPSNGNGKEEKMGSDKSSTKGTKSHKEGDNSDREHPGIMSKVFNRNGNKTDPTPPPSPPPSPPGRTEREAFAYTPDGNPLELFVDGPYGTATEEVFGFEVLILVGAGIGVTPFASILKTLAIQAKQDRLETPLKKVAFFWVCRDEKEFETFRTLLEGIVDDRSLANIFELNTYITGELDLKKFQAKSHGYNQFAGKPDWNRIGKETRKSFPESDVGVFLCGPNAIGQQLAAMCNKFNPPKIPGKKIANIPRFYFHKENF